MRKPAMKDADKNQWAFRWAHAQARIAARRGKTAEAQKQVAAPKAASKRQTTQIGRSLFLI
jgi:hypothetical protein